VLAITVATEDGVLDDVRRYGLAGADSRIYATLDAALEAAAA